MNRYKLYAKLLDNPKTKAKTEKKTKKQKQTPQPQIQPKPQPEPAAKVEAKPKVKTEPFHYKCAGCKAPIFYNEFWYNDFRKRYIPLSVYTQQPHRCDNKKQEKINGILSGTYVESKINEIKASEGVNK